MTEGERRRHLSLSASTPENEAVCRQKCKNGNEKMYAHGTKSNNTAVLHVPVNGRERADSTVHVHVIYV